MNKIENAVMPSLKGSMVNEIPTMENVDFDRIYHFTPDVIDILVEPEDCTDEEKGKYLFHFFTANRDISEKHVKEIKNEILNGKHKGKYFDNIRVDLPSMKIIDGQHRIRGFRDAWLEGATDDLRVRFECLPKDEREAMDVIIDIQKVDSWNLKSYEKKLRTEGNKAIISIDGFAQKHPLVQKYNKKGEVTGYNIRYVTAILLGRNATKEVKNGTITITEKDKLFGEKIYSEVEKIFNSIGFEMGPWFESFVHAWYNIRCNDMAYNEIIDGIGMDEITKEFGDYFYGFQPVTRKSKWEEKIRSVLYDINKKK